MDGHFVPNLTYGIPLIKALKKKTSIPIDVHIMISNPDEMGLAYVEAGADILTFHIEAAIHSHRLLQAIKAKGCKPGVSINPGTNLETLIPLLPEIEVINIMSVNPGFGGQKFIPQAVARIALLSEIIKREGLESQIDIEVDGGINDVTGKSVVDAGATVLVAGNYIYGANNRSEAVQSLLRL